MAAATTQDSFPTSAAFNFQQVLVLTTAESDAAQEPLQRIPMIANGLEVRTLCGRADPCVEMIVFPEPLLTD